MNDNETIGHLFELAIEMEQTAETFYCKLSTKFSHHNEVQDLWERMMLDEMEHKTELIRIRDSLGRDILKSKVDPEYIKDAKKFLRISIEDELAKIQNLDDAFEFSYRLEESEINRVFIYLLSKYMPFETKHEFLDISSNTHFARLNYLSKHFSGTIRMSIKPIS